jgi:serine/threonine protein phosphatase PrpC
MTRFETAQAVVAYRNRCEDRVAVFEAGDRTIVIVADGAGGIGGGDVAAETVIREIQSAHERVESAAQWEAELRQIDLRIGDGESTCAVVTVSESGLCGASVGDSQAWIIHDGEIDDLTVNQSRKPVLGSKNAMPVGFSRVRLAGTLVVATDGFCNYVKRDVLTAMVAQTDFYELPRRCVEMVRLPSGDLWDDIGVVVCRAQPRHRTRQRYEI